MYDSAEEAYYENPSLYQAEKYLTPLEAERFRAVQSVLGRDWESLLDVGAGNGQFLANVERDFPGRHLLGVERSQAAIDSKVCEAPFLKASIDDLPMAERSFDTVVALEVIEHLPYKTYEKGIGELARVAGNRAIISVPYRENRTRVSCSHCGCQFHPTFHMREFDEEKLSRLLAGFSLRRLELVTQKVPMFQPAVRVARQVLSGNPFREPTRLAASQCPQCGYRPTSKIQPKSDTLEDRIKNRVRKYWPMQSKPRWAVAVYERRSAD